MTICISLIPKPVSLTIPFIVLCDRDWQKVSEAFLLITMEKNAERKRAPPHITPFSFHFLLLKLQLIQPGEVSPKEKGSVFSRKGKALH